MTITRWGRCPDKMRTPLGDRIAATLPLGSGRVQVGLEAKVIAVRGSTSVLRRRAVLVLIGARREVCLGLLPIPGKVYAELWRPGEHGFELLDEGR